MHQMVALTSALGGCVAKDRAGRPLRQWVWGVADAASGWWGGARRDRPAMLRCGCRASSGDQRVRADESGGGLWVFDGVMVGALTVILIAPERGSE